jgi:hypothetical protein
MSWPGPHWPERDPRSLDGVRMHRGSSGSRLPKPLTARHRLVCRDGRVLEVQSTRVTTLQITVDRWCLGGYVVAISSRHTPPHVRPDVTWLDQAAS